jgi:aminoglycoside 6'-N-acetyltransferase I
MLGEWAALRHALWPEDTLENLIREAEAMLARSGSMVFVARDADAIAGFAEASLRPYVNGCEGSPVPFVEGLYVVPGARRHGVARALIIAVENWARSRGCRELASDVLLDNIASQDAHQALGFVETERVVYYRKPITR